MIAYAIKLLNIKKNLYLSTNNKLLDLLDCNKYKTKKETMEKIKEFNSTYSGNILETKKNINSGIINFINTSYSINSLPKNPYKFKVVKVKIEEVEEV